MWLQESLLFNVAVLMCLGSTEMKRILTPTVLARAADWQFARNFGNQLPVYAA